MILKSARIVFVVCLVVFCAGPLLWQLLTSLKTQPELVRFTLLPDSFFLGNYEEVAGQTGFRRSILNSLFVASCVTLLSLALGSLFAFGLAVLQVPGRSAILLLVLSASMFPQIAVVSPLYLVIRTLGLRDSLTALILVYTAFSLPLAIWVLHGFFKGVPGEIYSAARVDGCSPLQAFLRVILPLTAPGLAASGILIFLFSWGEFLFALTFTATPAARTVPVAISLFAGAHEIPWGEIAAASTIAIAPVFLLVLLFQKRIAAGLTAGAVKG